MIFNDFNGSIYWWMDSDLDIELCGRTLLSVPSHLAVTPEWGCRLKKNRSQSQKKPGIDGFMKTSSAAWSLHPCKFQNAVDSCVRCMDPEEYVTFTMRFNPTYEVQKNSGSSVVTSGRTPAADID